MTDTLQGPTPARRGTALFLAVAFGWSWAVGALIYKTGAMQDPALFGGLALLYMAGPAIGAFVCAALYDKGRRRDALGLRFAFGRGGTWLWLFLAWAIPVVFILGAAAFDILVGPPEPGRPGAQILQLLEARGVDPALLPPPAILAASQIGAALTLGAAINTFGTLTEEFGWRGWLWDRWRTLGFWRGNILIGLVWGVWHAPLIAQGYNYPGMPVWGPVCMTVFCAALAPLIGLVREKGGSILHAGMFHGTLNAFAGVAMLMLMQGAAFPWLGPLGVGGLVAAAALWGAAVLCLRLGR